MVRARLPLRFCSAKFRELNCGGSRALLQSQAEPSNVEPPNRGYCDNILWVRRIDDQVVFNVLRLSSPRASWRILLSGFPTDSLISLMLLDGRDGSEECHERARCSALSGADRGKGPLCFST